MLFAAMHESAFGTKRTWPLYRRRSAPEGTTDMKPTPKYPWSMVGVLVNAC